MKSLISSATICPVCVIVLAILFGLPAALATEGGGQPRREQQLLRDAEAILAPIREAGGYEAISARLKPWRAALAKRIEQIPRPRRGGQYVANDAPLDGGDGWILSGRRAKQLLYESDFEGEDAVGDRRNAAAERALVRTHHELAAMDIRLIVVPAPDKCDIYPERLAPLPDNVPTIHLKSRQLYLRLLHAGVEVLDCEPLLLARKGKESGPLYMMRDTHWSPAGSRLVAHAVAERLTEFRTDDAAIIERPDQQHAWDGDLAENWFRAGHNRYPKEKHRFIGVAMRSGQPVQPDANAPVLVLGDSYSTYPYSGHFAFWALLSQRLGRPVAFADRAGGGNAVLDRFRRLPEHKRRHIKAIVLLFTSCSFYEVDFREIPLLKTPPQVPDMPRARVTLENACPAIDPKSAAYENAVASLPATVDRGDGRPIRMLIHIPVMRDRKLLAAASWQKGQSLELDLHNTPPSGQGGAMVIETEEELDLPVVYVHRQSPG